MTCYLIHISWHFWYFEKFGVTYLSSRTAHLLLSVQLVFHRADFTCSAKNPSASKVPFRQKQIQIYTIDKKCQISLDMFICRFINETFDSVLYSQANMISASNSYLKNLGTKKCEFSFFPNEC